jgi:hypothetical protein
MWSQAKVAQGGLTIWNQGRRVLKAGRGAMTTKMDDKDLARLDESLNRRHADGSLYNESYSAAEVRALRSRLELAESENRCDACAGTGKPISGLSCMCGGTGKMSEAAIYLRKELVQRNTMLEDALDHLKLAAMQIDTLTSNKGD